MMGHEFWINKMVVIVIAAAVCASVAAGSILEDDKQLLEKTTTIEDESSQNLNERINSKSSSLSSKIKNETTTKAAHEKRIVHRLVGGHVKLYPKVTEAKDERETPPVVKWDDGLMMSSAGNGKEKSRRDDDDEEKKTLSQQVKEGKYGLIQNEIYPTLPKRPGIISYLGNPEVPKDTAKNLGGLEEEEIWLAENHLLVLRGGKFPDHGTKPDKNQAKWPPIDDYKAPPRQVKIPENPKVPPPFPVQLTEGGPIQIFGANGSAININDTNYYDEYANYPEGFFPGEAPFYPFPQNNSTDIVGYPGNFSDNNNGSYLPPEGSLGPFYPALPPGAVFLPPPNNQTEYDEDDQSIYYPPPYSFYYKKENATPVPPGPLVPGIILPPPPNFFASLEEKKSKSTTRNKIERFQTTTTTTGTTEVDEETSDYPTTTPTPRRKTVTKPHKVRFSTTTTTTTPITPTFSTRTKPTPRIQPQIIKNYGRTKPKEFTTTVPETIFISTPRYIESTTSRPDKPTTISDYYNVQTEIENHLIDLGTPQGGQWTGIVGSTAVPLLSYYGTTESVRSTDEISPIHVKPNGEDIRSKNQASYYYYEEKNIGPAAVRTTTESPDIYFKTNTEETLPYYNVETISTQRQPKKQYYSVEMIPSQQTANDYDVKLSSLIKTSQNYGGFTERNPSTNKYNLPERFRTQSQRTLNDNSQRYYQQPVTIKPYFTTQRPGRFYYQTSQNENYDYRDDQGVKSSPVYQYNYESTDYATKRQKGRYQEEEIREEPTYINDYQQPPSTIGGGQYYDYETSHHQTVDKIPQKTEEIPYTTIYRQRPSSSSSSSYPTLNTGSILNATPNPQHAYYTKQDEQLLDDVTKQYFTIFGKKLPETVVLPSTTPIYRIPIATTTENPIIDNNNNNNYVSNHYSNSLEPPNSQHFIKQPKVKVHYGDQTQRPYSLEDDTLVNYKNPLPPINPDAEFIDIRNINKPIINTQRPIGGYRTDHHIVSSSIVNRPQNNYVTGSNPREIYNRGRYTSPSISLANDIAVNYRDPRPQINPDAEFITPVQGQGNNNNNNNNNNNQQANRGGSYFAYQLPGNGGHFYFLTPQAIPQRQQNNINNVNRGEYLYNKSTPPRIIRRRRITTSDG